MKNLKICLMILLCLTVIAACDSSLEKNNVRFVAKSGSFSPTLSQGGQDTLFYTPDLSKDIQTSAKSSKIDEYDQAIDYVFNGREIIMPYMDTISYPNGSYVNHYMYLREERMYFMLSLNNNGSIVGFTCYKEPMIIEPLATTEEQRKINALAAIEQFLFLNLSDWSHSETIASSSTGHIMVTFKKMISGKYTGFRCSVGFTEDGEIFNIYCDSGIDLQKLEAYPDFDRDECYKVATEKLLEELNQSKSFAKYSNIQDRESYIEIGDTLYYKFEFRIDFDKALTEHTDVSKDETLSNTSIGTIPVFVELVT